MTASRQYFLDQVMATSPDATVWRGRCARPGERRDVVVKRVAASGRDAVAALAAAEHPNVVRVLDVAEAGDGVTVVMQFADGGTLADLLAARALDAGEMVAVVAPIADALAAAHARGIVHGDVKPANVLLTAEGEPLLADFGGPARGTDGYAAPEQHLGAVDPRSDVYALGVVCHEALGNHVPAALEPVLARAVAAAPEARIASASELAELLRAAVPADEVRLPGRAPVQGRAVARATRQFGPRPPAAMARQRRRLAPMLLMTVGAVALVCGAFAFAPRDGRVSMPDCAGAPSVPVGAQAVRGDTSARGCRSVGVYADQVLTIRVSPSDPEPRRFALGRPGDVLQLGDWNCDGIATPALFRPSTGETLYYETWDAHEHASASASCAP